MSAKVVEVFSPGTAIRESESGVVDCAVCGAQNARTKMAACGSLKECIACGLQFLHPQPTEAEIARFYGENYFFTNDIGEEQQSLLKRSTARLYLDQIGRARSNKKPGKLLEIGCGNGYFLLEAMTSGYSIKGIEFSKSAAGNANSRLGGIFVSAANVDNVTIERDSFDVIVACDVIEHVRDPQKFLQTVYAALSPGGVFYCVTPTLDSFSAKLMGKSWVEYKREHLYYFNSHHLTRLLTGAGFSNITNLRNQKVLSPRYVITHFKRFPRAGWTEAARLTEMCMPGWILDLKMSLTASGMAVCALK